VPPNSAARWLSQGRNCRVGGLIPPLIVMTTPSSPFYHTLGDWRDTSQLGLPDFPRRNTGEFCPSIHPSPVRPMCRYIIPCMLPSGHKFHISSEYCQNFNRPKIESNPSLFSLVNSAVNMTLPAFAAERRAAGPGCGAVDRYLARTALSSKPAARRCCVRLTNGHMDGRTPDRFIDPDPHTMRTVSKSESSCQIADAQPH